MQRVVGRTGSASRTAVASPTPPVILSLDVSWRPSAAVDHTAIPKTQGCTVLTKVGDPGRYLVAGLAAGGLEGVGHAAEQDDPIQDVVVVLRDLLRRTRHLHVVEMLQPSDDGFEWTGVAAPQRVCLSFMLIGYIVKVRSRPPCS